MSSIKKDKEDKDKDKDKSKDKGKGKNNKAELRKQLEDAIDVYQKEHPDVDFDMVKEFALKLFENNSFNEFNIILVGEDDQIFSFGFISLSNEARYWISRAKKSQSLELLLYGLLAQELENKLNAGKNIDKEKMMDDLLKEYDDETVH
jgi:hypothetical protein